MKKVELLQKLSRQGAVFARHGARHDVYVQPRTNKEAAVPRQGDIREGAARTAP
jgi:hypothetical protein